jgi:phage terminase small subunit
MANRKNLTPRQMKFVAAYISGKGGAESARFSGYSPANARGRAYELLNENKTVMAAIAEAQEQVRREANFSAEKAMDELNQAMQFARETKNATALARCIELRAKLAGLLDTKDKGGPTAAFQININGIESPEPGANSIYD